MRLLFCLDTRDYNPTGKITARNSARAIIIRGGKIALIHSLKYNYYKFPGGGIGRDESNIEALIRETAEEAGLAVAEQSVTEYGCVHRAQRDDYDAEGIFVQDNFYYLCEVGQDVSSQRLDGYEKEEEFTLEWVDPDHAIQANTAGNHGPTDAVMLARETTVLKMLIDEGYFK